MAAYGIDFGATELCMAAVVRNGQITVIKDDVTADYKVPAVVCFEDKDSVIIGSNAKDCSRVEPERCVSYIKHKLGDPSASAYTFDGVSYTPVEISALLLMRLKQIGEECGEYIKHVVLTCPASFGLIEKMNLRKAAELAGLNVVDMIPDRTAALLNYVYSDPLTEEKKSNILVYDLGGSTFSAVLAQLSVEKNNDGILSPKLKVINSAGDSMLGGKDWDDRLYNHFVYTLCDEYGLSPEDFSDEELQTMRLKSEEMKKRLSVREKTVFRTVKDKAAYSVGISREEFEEMTQDLAERTMSYVEDVLANAGDIDIDTILLVGGSTHMPVIREILAARFPGKEIVHEPDFAVARGAAIYSEILSGNIIADSDK